MAGRNATKSNYEKALEEAERKKKEREQAAQAERQQAETRALQRQLASEIDTVPGSNYDKAKQAYLQSNPLTGYISRTLTNNLIRQHNDRIAAERASTVSRNPFPAMARAQRFANTPSISRPKTSTGFWSDKTSLGKTPYNRTPIDLATVTARTMAGKAAAGVGKAADAGAAAGRAKSIYQAMAQAKTGTAPQVENIYQAMAQAKTAAQAEDELHQRQKQSIYQAMAAAEAAEAAQPGAAGLNGTDFRTASMMHQLTTPGTKLNRLNTWIMNAPKQNPGRNKQGQYEEWSSQQQREYDAWRREGRDLGVLDSSSDITDWSEKKINQTIAENNRKMAEERDWLAGADQDAEGLLRFNLERIYNNPMETPVTDGEGREIGWLTTKRPPDYYEGGSTEWYDRAIYDTVYGKGAWDKAQSGGEAEKSRAKEEAGRIWDALENAGTPEEAYEGIRGYGYGRTDVDEQGMNQPSRDLTWQNERLRRELETRAATAALERGARDYQDDQYHDNGTVLATPYAYADPYRWRPLVGGDEIDQAYYRANHPWFEGEAFWGTNAEIGKADVTYFMTPDQVSTFNRYYNMGDKESAKAYLDGLNSWLLSSRANWQRNQAERAASDPAWGWLTTIESFATKPIEGLVGTVGSIGATFGADWADEAGDPIFDMTRRNMAVRETRGTIWGETAQDIWKAMSGQPHNEMAARIGNMMYSVITSTGDNLVAMGISTFAGGPATKAGMIMVQTIMSNGASAQKTVEELAKGRNPTEAGLMGIGCGIIEAVTEKYSIEALLSDRGNVWKYLRNSWFAEGSEEVAADWLNTGYDAVMSLIFGHKNEIQEGIDAFKAANADKYKDPDELNRMATRHVLLQMVGQHIESFVAGSLGGLLLAGGRVALDSAQGRAQAGRIQRSGRMSRILNAAEGMEGSQKFKETIARAKQTMETEGNLSTRETANVLRAIRQQGSETVQKVTDYEMRELIRERLNEYTEEDGERLEGQDAAELVEAIQKAVVGDKKLSLRQRRVLTGSRHGVDIVREFMSYGSETSAELDTRVGEHTKAETETFQVIRDTLHPTEGVIREIIGSQRLNSRRATLSTENADTRTAGREELDQAGIGENAERGQAVIYGEDTMTAGRIIGTRGRSYIVQTENGEQTVSFAEAKAADPVTAAVMNFIESSNTDDDFAGLLLKTAQNKAVTRENVAAMLREAREVQIAGWVGAQLSRTGMAEEAAREIYQAGVNARAEFDARPAKKEADLHPGNGQVEYDGIDLDTVSEKLRREMDAMAAIAKHVGFNVHFVNNKEQSQVYGSYDRGTVTINIAGVDAIGIHRHTLTTASHELTHMLERNAPKAYKALMEFTFAQIRKNGGQRTLSGLISRKIDQYNYQFENNRRQVEKAKAEGREYDDSLISGEYRAMDLSGAVAEVVAEACDQVLSDESLIRQMAESNPSLYRRVQNFVKDFYQKVLDAVSGMQGSRSQESLYITDAKEMAKRWGVALRETQAAYETENGGENAGENADGETDGAQMSFAEMDARYEQLVQEGAWDEASQMVYDKLSNIDGLTLFDYIKGYRTKEGRSHGKGIKQGDAALIAEAAEQMAPRIPDNAVLVPMPSHTGQATDTLVLAKAISAITGAPVIEALGGEQRGSIYAAKKAGKTMTAADLKIRQVKEIPQGKQIYIIDNVVASGTSAQAAEQALGGGITFAYAYGNVGGNIRGLKQTGITFASEADRKAGKPIPLSERGNLANPDVRWSLAGYMAEGAAGRAAQQAAAMHKQGKSDAEIFAATGAIPGYNGRYWKVLDNAKTRLKTNYRTAVEQNRFNNEVLLGDIFEAKEIYEAYPAAKEISVDFWDSRVRSRGAYGAMTPQGTMMINPELSRPDTETAIRHELQHWIQDQEGSENGSNQRTWTWIRNVIRNEQYGATTQSYMEALRKVDPTGAVGIAAVNHQIFNEDGSVVKSLLQKNVRAAAMDIDLDIRQELGRLDAARWKMRRLLFGDLSQMSDYELYLNTVGEMEARHVQQTGEGQFVPISYGQAVSIEEYDDLARMETDFQIDLADGTENDYGDAASIEDTEGRAYSFAGIDEETGRRIYISNFEQGTPRTEKIAHGIELIRNIWSKQSIPLRVYDQGNSEGRIIQATFDPDFDESGNRMTDAGKILYGNHIGNNRERRIAINLLDDYIEILESSRYYGSQANREGHNEQTHKGILAWHYFVNDLYYMERGADEMVPFRMEIDVKEKEDGTFVYTFGGKQIRGESIKKLSAPPYNTEVNQSKNGSADAQFEDTVPQTNKNENGESGNGRINDAEPAYSFASYNEDADTNRINLPSEEIERAAEKAFPNTKARTPDGRLMPVYHGTKAQFTVFDTSISGGVNGTQEGFGIYLTDDPSIAGQYASEGRVISAYVNMERPAYTDRKTIKRAELVRLIKAASEKEAQQLVEEGDHDNINDALRDTWISNYVYTPDYRNIQGAYTAVANMILEQNDNDSDIVNEVMAGLAIRDYRTAMDFYHNILTPQTGIDGIWAKWRNRQTGETANVLLAFDSSQIKSNEDVTYDDEGNPIPLDERFNKNNPDIRYSFRNDATQTREGYAYSTASENPVDIRDWMMGLEESDLNTQDEKILLRNYKARVAEVRETQQRIQEAQDKLQGASRAEAQAIRVNLRTLNNILDRQQRALDDITSSTGYAQMLRNGQRIIDDYLTGRTADQVRTTTNAMKRKAEEMRKAAQTAAQTIEQLVGRQDVAILRSYFGREELTQVAEKLIKQNSSSMTIEEAENALAAIVLKLTAGENFMTDAQTFAGRLVDSFMSEMDRSLLETLRGQTFNLDDEQMAEFPDMKIRDINARLIGTGIRFSHRKGAPGIGDSKWSELSDSIGVNNEAPYRTWGREIFDRITSILEGNETGRYDQFADVPREEKVQSAMMDIMNAAADLHPNLPADPRMKNQITELIRFVNEIGRNNDKTAQQIRQLEEIARQLETRSGQVASSASVANRDVIRAIDYFNEMAKKARAENIADGLEETTRQLQSDATERILEAQERYRQALETDRTIRAATEARAKLRRQISTIYNRMEKLLLKETDLKNVPEGYKSLARATVKLILENDISGGKRITTNSFRDLTEEKRIHDALDQRDGTVLDLSAFQDDAAFDGDQDITQAITDALDDIRAGISAYQGNTGSRQGNLQADGNALQRIQKGLNAIYDIIQTARESDLNGRRILTEDLAYEVETDARNATEFKGELVGRAGKAADGAFNAINWGNLTPEYFFRRLRNRGLQKIWNEGFHGAENKAGLLTARFAARVNEIAEKHGYSSWDMGKPLTLRTERGETITLTIEQAMSLYATWKREKTLGPEMSAHLEGGGIVVQESNDGRFWGRQKTELKPRRISDADMNGLTAQMTDAQKAYADEMVEILSKDASELGNDASMRMYGIRKYNEAYYFPFRVWDGVKNKASNAGSQLNPTNNNRAAHQSWTNRRKNGARNALAIGDFTSTCVDHISQMITYTSFAPVIETMNKVLNFQVSEHVTDETGETQYGPQNETRRSVETILTQQYGRNAVGYLRDLMKDLNGGAVQDHRKSVQERLLSVFKRGAVAGSLSVALQQPLSYIRAGILINPKYLAAAIARGKYRATVKEMGTYSGLAVIKDMGRFDMGYGQSAREYITPEAKKSTARNAYDAAARWATILPEMMDRLTWSRIWVACKLETADRNPGMDQSSPEFLAKVGERFNEVIRRTQVYDSVLVKSSNMRSQNYTMKTLTAFMAEPTLTANVLMDAWHDRNTRGGKRRMAAAAGAYIFSAIMQAAVKGIMGAGRTPDEKKTLAENFLNRFIYNFIGEANPLSLIPGYNTLIDALSGRTIEDNAWGVIKDLIDIIPKTGDMLTGQGRDWYRDLEDTAGVVAQIFTGIPAKNIMRDMRAISNFIIGEYADRPHTVQDAEGNDVVVPGRPTSMGVIRYQAWDTFASNGLIGMVNGWLGEYGYKTGKEAYYQRIYEARRDGNTAAAEEMSEYLTAGQGVSEKTLRSKIASAARADETTSATEKAEFLYGGGYNTSADFLTERYKAGEMTDAEFLELYAKYFPDKDGKAKLLSIAKERFKAGEATDSQMAEAFGKYGTKEQGDAYFLTRAKDRYKAGEITEKEVRAAFRQYGEAGKADAWLWSLAEEKYKAGNATRAETEAAWKKYHPGKTADDAYWAMDRMAWVKEHGSEDGYSKYNAFDAAIERKDLNGIRNATKILITHGTAPATIKKSVGGYIKPLYMQAGKGSRAEAEYYNLANAAMETAGIGKAEREKYLEGWRKEKAKET